MMNLNDFLIIYLACGTPFGVYHFFQHQKSDSHYLKSLLIVFVWIPYAARLLSGRLLTIFSDSDKSDFNRETELKLDSAKKNLEIFLIEKIENFPTFEFRETIERYTGLAFAVNAKNFEATGKNVEFHTISGSDNKKLAAACLHRRNLKLLIFHHSLARRDFLKFISKYCSEIEDQTSLQKMLLKISDILQDSEAEKVIFEESTKHLQTSKSDTVTKLEEILWNPERPETIPAKRVISTLKPVKTISTLRFKD